MHPSLESDTAIWTFLLVKTLWSLVDLFSIISHHKLKENMIHLQEVASPYFVSFLDDSDGKGSSFSADSRPIPRSGRSPGEANGYPLQYSYLEDFMDKGAWWTTVRGVTKSWTQRK